ncbi:efflux RND transporter permease subunit [Methylobacterium sp. J-026]|uniref:efflux RND transporter permease subunit n=1 Tax=Methylobacterium sp. J-026 TaxID=2836624 RepID=UPI001FB97FCB|nr:efflux RND transporter permease subunit [Methylobacterium sp. J-026]MCJ2134074.1 efflux RND transporter permease subunit [Methylobacterium sp. J-026]
MSHFFIDRPVFAWVMGLAVMLIGGLSITRLPIAQYPSIAAPQISISVTYPGASAETVADTVVRPILQQMTGLDGLQYIASSTQANGSMEIDCTFVQGTDPNIAQVQVQNKLSLAQASLPSEVTQQGIRVAKATRNFMLIVGLRSVDGSMSGYDINDYIASNLQDALTRIPGVGDFTLFGAEYAMRIWLDPDKLFKYALTISDVTTALTAQNIQVSAGELGGLPARAGQRLNATIIGPARLTTAEQFGAILLKVAQGGSEVLLRDVARIEIGAQSYATTSSYNGKPAGALALKLAAGANQLTTERAAKAELDRLSRFFPPGLEVVYPLDTEPFITLSIEEVVKTLLEAIALVFVVMLVFLQNLRATLIPTIAVPVVLLGTFGVLTAFGYSINTLTMLAMVLAVGLLVDDAIVVVENVERLMRERNLSPRDATRASMDEISGALIGISLVLSAVFLPMAFFGGSTGVIYRQFSVTIIAAMLLSVAVALVLTPALCAALLKPHGETTTERGLGAAFNRGFDAVNGRYARMVAKLVRRRRLALVGFAALSAAAAALFLKLPSGFLPDEDQAMLFGQVALPQGATAEQTAAVNARVVDYLLSSETKNVDSVLSVVGFNFSGQAQNAGFLVVKLKDWSVRTAPAQAAAAVAGRLMQHFGSAREAMIFGFQPPAVMELGNATGFDLQLEDRGQVGRAALIAARNQLLGAAARTQGLVGVRPNGLEDAPQYRLEIDHAKANALGVATADLNATIQGAFGSTYVNQFNRSGRVKQVYVQGNADSRMLPSDLARWYVRNSSGGMVPFDAFLSASWTTGAQKVEGYNGLISSEILGMPAPGVSSGTAMAAIEAIAATLPPGIGYEWTGLSYEQVQSGSQTAPLYAISFVAVLLCLAAIYESWPVPLAVLLVVPLGALGAILATLLHGLANDVYFQVGLLTTVGLAVKNAILIVEFAKAFFDSGTALPEAALKAAQERLRPILMTSIAFVFGTLPLAFATGAGAASRVAIGTAVVGGMVTATFLVILFVPVFFVSVLTLFRVKPRRTAPALALEEV